MLNMGLYARLMYGLCMACVWLLNNFFKIFFHKKKRRGFPVVFCFDTDTRRALYLRFYTTPVSTLTTANGLYWPFCNRYFWPFTSW